MASRLYTAILKPRSTDQDSQNRELVLSCILLGMLSLAFAEFLGSLFEFAVMSRFYLIYRLLAVACVLTVFAAMYWYVRQKQRHRFAAFAVIFLLTAFATAMVCQWGNLTPSGLLLFGLTIVVAGILINSWFSLYMATVSGFVLLTLEILKDRAIVRPNLAWMSTPSSMGDVFAFSVLFLLLALPSWLFNHQMERSLKRAHRSEAALLRQKDLLEIKVKERTHELEAAQLDKVQQVYRFAELGRISSALFHDLANHLTTVSLDIEGLKSSDHTDLMKRIRHDIGYIDDVVQRVRLQLRGQISNERLNLGRQIDEVIQILNYKMIQNHVAVTVTKPSRSLYIDGDLTRVRQIIINLLGNAIDAYDATTNGHEKVILVHLSGAQNQLSLSITDWGVGIPAPKLTKVFEPFYSSKTNGTGIGLFIVHQIVEHDLHGRITVTSNSHNGTTFSVVLPKSNR